MKHSCNLHNSGLAIWGTEFKHHISTGGQIKCDECRNGTWWISNDGPAYVCKICNKGFCTSCGPNHLCQDKNICSSENCDLFNSGLTIWSVEFQHHLSTGGQIKCDVCRNGTWWIGHDGPAYICKICRKGICTSCVLHHN